MQRNTKIARPLLLCAFTGLFSQCNSKPSALPVKMPAYTEMAYRKNGDGYLLITSLTIKNDSLFYYERKEDDKTEIRWQTAISMEEEEMIYRLFRANKIDLVKNEPANIRWEGAASEDLYLSYDTINYHVRYGANTPLSQQELKRFNTVKDKVNALKEKYQPAN